MLCSSLTSERRSNQLEEKKYAGEVHLFYLDTENEIVRVLDRARVLIDLGTPPDLYAQIAAISAGVPQIVLNAEQLVEHEKNGLVLQGDINNLTKAIKYYTQELKFSASFSSSGKVTLKSGALAKIWARKLCKLTSFFLKTPSSSPNLGCWRINSAFLKNFKYSEYENIQALVTEKFNQFLQQVTNEDAFVCHGHQKHTA